MRAVVVREPGGPEVLTIADVPEPLPGPHEVVVEVRATALNRADLLQRRGLYPPPPGASDVLGLECSGIVSRLGAGAQRFPIGARVMALLAGGGYAERVVVHEDVLLPIPERLSFAEAAAVPEAFLTASEALLVEGQLQSGESLLVTAAASGVGSAAVQIGKLRGAFVVGSASTEKLAVVRSLGADVALDRRRDDFVSALGEATSGHGADVILDFVGGSTLGRHQDCLAASGRLVVAGLLGGNSATIDLGRLLTRRQRLLGLVMRTRPLAEKIELTRRFEREIMPALSAGAVSPRIDLTLPFSEVVAAHARMERNLNTGKIVLELR